MPTNGPIGQFVSTSDIFDVSNLEGNNLTTEEFKQFFIVLTERINQIAITLNQKESGIYNLQDFITGNLFFPNPNLSSITPTAPQPRPSLRKTFNILDGTVATTLPNNGSIAYPHGIDFDSNYTLIDLWGGATDPINLEYLPLPFSSPTAVANNISLSADATHIFVATGTARSSFTRCIVTIEFLSN